MKVIYEIEGIRFMMSLMIDGQKEKTNKEIPEEQ